ncbi:MAG: HupE/UreJ family protein [Archangium sp.]
MISTTAFAHKGSDAYWSLKANGRQLTGHFDVALVDLDYILPLDGNGDGKVTWSELLAREADARSLISKSLSLNDCPLTLGELSVIRHSDGNYARFAVTANCTTEVDDRAVTYSLLFDADPTHRGLISVSGQGEGHWQAFTTTSRTQTISFKPIPRSTQAWTAFTEGVHHIAIGWDHLCFLFALLLPSVLRREHRTWIPRDVFRPSLLDVTKVVTAFTIAHSITLALASFDVVSPDGHAVEIAIAVSVALAAFNNLVPFVPDTRWSLAFSLGLLHGFGFVSAIADLGADDATKGLSVLCFNLGVETGQLAIVAAFVPLAWKLRETKFYRSLLFPLGSAVILGVALFWTAERI